MINWGDETTVREWLCSLPSRNVLWNVATTMRMILRRIFYRYKLNYK